MRIDRLPSWVVRLGVYALVMSASTSAATQAVFLDFDSGNDATIDYQPSMRDQVQSMMEDVYARFDVVFSQTAPAAPFSTLTFNEGFPGGVAEQIDFRNLDPEDDAVLNVEGLGVAGTAQIVRASATVGAHELGHLLGLRHGDSFGPIGAGIGSTGPGADAYLPTYPGPSGGDEIENHIMATPAIGANNLLADNFLSERSATKLQFAVSGTAIQEAAGDKSTLATAQPITFEPIVVPNTIEVGDNAGPLDFSVDAVSVRGRLFAGGEIDIYRFDAMAGDLFNFEVMSGAIDQRIVNTIDSQISILDTNGDLIPYYGSTAFNDDEFETLDAILIDLIIPADGTYYAQVNPFNPGDRGGYELFGYRFNGVVPEPASWALWAVGMLMFARRRAYPKNQALTVHECLSVKQFGGN